MASREELPFERFRLEEGSTLLWIREGYAASLRRVGIQRPASLLGDRAGRRSGRGPVAVLPLSDRPGEQAVLKRYRRGGIAGRLLPDLFFGTGKFRRELRTAEEAVRRGLPIPLPLALVRQGRFGLYMAFGVTREIPASRNLSEMLEGPVSPSRWRRLIRRTARAVRDMHDRGMSHADLNLSNLLVSDAEPPGRIHFVDLGGARLLPELSLRDRRRALRRLRRSWEKHLFSKNRRSGSEVARFLVTYASGDPRLLRALQRWSFWSRFSLSLHRGAWRLAGTDR